MEAGYTTIPVEEYHRLLRHLREMGLALRVIRTWAATDLDERTRSPVPARAVVDLCDKVLGE